VRLRFVAVLAIACLTITNWDHLRGRWDALIGPAARDASMAPISPGTEFFCPMDPGVVSAWPGKCPVCNMFLVVRSRGDMTPLPSGVVARVQISPDRILFAGIKTSPVEFRPLSRTISAFGRLERRDGRWIVAPAIAEDDRPLIRDGMAAGVAVEGNASTIEGRVRIEVADHPIVELNTIPPGEAENVEARVTIHQPIADREPFRSQPHGPVTLSPGSVRVVYHCPEHLAVTTLASGKCPIGGETLERQALSSTQAVSWACRSHPEVVSHQAGSSCSACGGMELSPRVVSYRPVGQVLAVPTSSIIDTGTRKLVYVEGMPGTFDAVVVQAGPSCDGFASIVSGLEAGQRVVDSGAFLIDAETRLNPRLASAYFGAARGRDDHGSPDQGHESSGLASLSEADRRLAIRQKTCPVTGKALGSMGEPPRIRIAGSTVFLCCDGCEDRLRRDPSKYLKAKPDGPRVGP
jgi:hypothetical protein